MNCPKCGENYSEPLATCPKCGASLEGGAAEINPDSDTEHLEVTDRKHEAAGGLDEKTLDAVMVGSPEEAVGKLAAAQIADEATNNEPVEAAGGAAEEKIEAQAAAQAEGKVQTYQEWEQEHKEYFDHLDSQKKKPAKMQGFAKFTGAIAKLPVYKKAILGACAVLVVAAIIFGGWYLKGTVQLKKALQKDWALVEDTNDFFIRVLSFDDDKATFTFESRLAWLNNTIATYEYSVLSPSKVKFKTGELSKTLKIELTSEGNVMTITPALTDDSAQQTWKVVDKDRLQYWK